MHGNFVLKKYFSKMSDQQNTSGFHMEIDNYAIRENSSNVVNNYFSTPTSQNSEPLPNFPNQILETLTVIKKFLSRQKDQYEITITKDEVKVNGRAIHVNYEPCKVCKNQHGHLTCSKCERKVCSNCVIKRAKTPQCFRCKGSEKAKDKLNSDFDEKIDKLLKLESDDKVQQTVQVEIENLGGKTLEELIEIVKKLEVKRDKLDRAISIAYFYVGKVFYERMEEFFNESGLVEKEKNRKIIGSFRHAKDLDFGGDKMSILEIKEKLGVDDNKISRFFGLTLKVFLTYKDFESSEEQIRKATGVPATGWLRDLSQEKFLNFLERLEEWKKEEEI
jgi:hypothetical protein